MILRNFFSVLILVLLAGCIQYSDDSGEMIGPHTISLFSECPSKIDCVMVDARTVRISNLVGAGGATGLDEQQNAAINLNFGLGQIRHVILENIAVVGRGHGLAIASSDCNNCTIIINNASFVGGGESGTAVSWRPTHPESDVSLSMQNVTIVGFHTAIHARPIAWRDGENNFPEISRIDLADVQIRCFAVGALLSATSQLILDRVNVSGCTQIGMNLQAGQELSLHNITVTESVDGVYIGSSGAHRVVALVNSTIAHNRNHGFFANANVILENSTIEGNALDPDLELGYLGAAYPPGGLMVTNLRTAGQSCIQGNGGFALETTSPLQDRIGIDVWWGHPLGPSYSLDWPEEPGPLGDTLPADLVGMSFLASPPAHCGR